jgi:MFS transporter, putative metabolite:H+ symporter
MSAALPLSVESIVARVEGLPVTRWHSFMRILAGSATFFDAFDSVAIAFVIPVLAGLWHLSPTGIGMLVSIGYVGQMIGAIFFGWLAERYGRLRALTWSILVISVFSLGCAASPDFNTLAAMRFLQGLGLGGEVPIALAYINEFARAEKRGRFVLIFQSLFPTGILCVSFVSLWMVPQFGWQSLFLIGAIPALIAAVLRRSLPESPRWLATHGRLAEADQVVRGLEQRCGATVGGDADARIALPTGAAGRTASWRDLFGGIYRRRTLLLWVTWFTASFVGYGITIWMPTIYRSVFKLPLQEALFLSLLTNVAVVLGALAITFTLDRIGRRRGFSLAFLFCGLPLIALWAIGRDVSLVWIVTLTTVASFFIAMMQLSLVLYASELYPTRMRALGSGIASSWTRIGSMIGPPVVGMTLQRLDIAAVYLVLGTVALATAAVMVRWGVESRGVVLEELSP